MGILAGLGWFLFPRPGNDRGGEAARPVVSAPAALPPAGGREPEGKTKPIEPAPAPVKPPALLSGTVRDEQKDPIASALVYLAMHPPARDDMGQDAFLGGPFRPDYFKRSRFLATKTDEEGRYSFEQAPEPGVGTLSAFKEDYSGALDGVRIEKGGELSDLTPTALDLFGLVKPSEMTGRSLICKSE